MLFFTKQFFLTNLVLSIAVKNPTSTKSYNIGLFFIYLSTVTLEYSRWPQNVPIGSLLVKYIEANITATTSLFRQITSKMLMITRKLHLLITWPFHGRFQHDWSHFKALAVLHAKTGISLRRV